MFFQIKKNKITCGGARIECEKINLSDINYAYQKEYEEELHISLNFNLEVSDINELEGKTLSLGSEVEETWDDLGSVYAFGAHNPVGWQQIKFGTVENGLIDAEVELFFDFDHEDTIGGKFHHSMKVQFSQENRWE